ncbi:leucine-rich repeat domain-containing protein [Leptolyngbya sp. FACHB-36]|uniref:COR domain-containing protein n=1 Tax=Leptolyngbya sp. FACHB-36 TaxID=2692808 RepID=UPI00167FFCAB|nr:COR domain-containing protein [Leptolyngbya sp. FACHB-36]MBD2020802.1 leucine-rich repeat domain-containing protein [Leptolyngbya sp. FACHB-36]
MSLQNSSENTPEWALERIRAAKEQNLRKLDLNYHVNTTGQKLSQIPVELFELKQLEVLDLSNNQIAEISADIKQLQNLSILNLFGNQISEISVAIGQLQSLIGLHLAYNQITEIPAVIGQLQSLSRLNLSGNQITEIPAVIGQLQNLLKLNLSNNQITEIPAVIGQLQNLLKLNLSNNLISKIPVSIGQLRSLLELNLSYNQITEIPTELEQLKKVSELNLSRNQITKVRVTVEQLKNLSKLDLSFNPLEDLPLEIAERGIKAIRSYFSQEETEGVDHLYEAKLLILGEPGAGKTTLAKKIQDSNYQLQDEDSTQGIDVIQYYFPYNNHTFRINLWDFGGQEIYHSTHQFFLTKRSLYALVADTRKEDTDFHYWLNIVELLSDNSPLLIVKNEKHDRHRELDEAALRGQFTNLQRTLATNLATGRGLPELLKEIQHQIVHLPHIGTALPKTWVRVRTALETETREHISLEEYLEICKANGFKTRQDALQLSGYLHDLGVCLHFQDDPLLKRSVVLKPQWGTDAVYKVLDNKTVERNFGRFNRRDLVAIWKHPSYLQMQDELLQIMVKFRLCYQIPHTDDYIAPQLLSVSPPAYEWDDRQNLLLRFTYEFMPKGILTQLIVAMHRSILDQTAVWRSGVILVDGETKAEVIETYNRREIRVRVAGRDKKRWLDIVTHELDKIHASYKRLKYQKLIPCNCSTCKPQQNPHFYDFEVLRRFIDDRQPHIQCQRSYEMVNVVSLIEDVTSDRAKWLRPRDDRYSTSAKIASEKAVFISYAWGKDGEEREEIVNQLCRSFEQRGIKIVRDKETLKFKESIRDFMQQIGHGYCVICIISDKYLKSRNCMFELVQIAEHGEFNDRIFPIVLPDSKIYDPVDCADYILHWEEECRKLEAKLKQITSSANLPRLQRDRNLYEQIRGTIDGLVDILQDMNTLTPEMHLQSEFEQLFDAVMQKLED